MSLPPKVIGVLQFYANPDNYCRLLIPHLADDNPRTFAPVLQDNGVQASEILAAISESAPPPKMSVFGNTLNVYSADGATQYTYTYEYLQGLIAEQNKIREERADMEHAINMREPDRFLPELVSQLEGLFASAMAAKDTGRAESYAAAVLLIRGFLRDFKKRERR